MPVTLLVGHPKASWREWLKANGAKKTLLILDPADTEHGPPACARIVKNEKSPDFRFLGSVDPLHNPLGILAAAAELAPPPDEDVIALLPSLRWTPLVRQMMLSVAQLLKPIRILVPESSRLEKHPWPVGAETVELPAPFPPLVKDAQRRARWIELLDSCVPHTVDLAEVALMGSRLGSGTRLAHKDFSDYGEVAGGILHIVTDRQLTDQESARAMDVTHARKLSLVSPSAYRGLLCSFADQEGADFGLGIVKSFDPDRARFEILGNPVAPAPVRILKIGLQRLTESGQEDGVITPWSL